MSVLFCYLISTLLSFLHCMMKIFKTNKKISGGINESYFIAQSVTSTKQIPGVPKKT